MKKGTIVKNRYGKTLTVLEVLGTSVKVYEDHNYYHITKLSIQSITTNNIMKFSGEHNQSVSVTNRQEAEEFIYGTGELDKIEVWHENDWEYLINVTKSIDVDKNVNWIVNNL